MATPTLTRCGVCKFWDPITKPQNLQDKTDGHCKRYPPTVETIWLQHPQQGPIPNTQTVLVITKTDAWCGEFAMKLALTN